MIAMAHLCFALNVNIKHIILKLKKRLKLHGTNGMSNWYRESLNTKKRLIHQVWKDLGIINMYLDLFQLDYHENPVDGDGTITVHLSVYDDDRGESESYSYRSIYVGHERYIRHSLKTLAIRLAKRHFNIPTKE